MISTIVYISLLRLWHNRSELVLTFAVPILFFSIFAWIFGSRSGSGATPQLKIAICDQVQSEWTRLATDSLEETKSLQIYQMPADSKEQQPKQNSRREVEALVQRGTVSAAIVFSQPEASSTPTQPGNNASAKIEILADSFDQVAGQILTALVQRSALQAEARMLPAASGGTVPSMPPVQTASTHPRSLESTSAFPSSAERSTSALPKVPAIEVVDLLGDRKSNPVIAMYAAGIAVMFSLFSATTASGSLLEEQENSTLERLLCSGMTIDHLLMGKWCYMVFIGTLQTSLMFVVGALFFGLSLSRHVDGFVAMTLVTAAASASFALMLASLCKSRAQLGWVSTIVILTMSALGGSMVPRYLMSEQIQQVGQFTFNAWALDGYHKVFWRELPIEELRRELMVLVGCGFSFMAIARMAAVRWDRS